MKAVLPFLMLLTSLPVMNAQVTIGACKVEPTMYRGWKALKLSNGIVTAHVTPDLGGRVIQFQLGEHPFFWVNLDLAGQVFPPEENGGEKGGWKNYGGDKLWPAPQGWEREDQWPGPPDPVLDGGKYQAEIIAQNQDRVAVRLTSPADQRTGIQFSRTISLYAGTTQVRHECTMKNISRRPVRWGIWQVTQHDAADSSDPAQSNHDLWAYCPLNPRSVHPQGFYPMFGQANHPSYRPDRARGLLGVQYDYRVGKIGLDSAAGWLAVVNGKTDHCFIGQFTWFAGLPYPDQASVEFWLNGAGEFLINGVSITNAADPKLTPYLLESEILSPLADLQPGQDYQFTINWLATRCPKPVVEVTTAGAIHKPLSVSIGNGQVMLEGVFGVFQPGHAEAVFKARDGKIVGREHLGGVVPDRVFRLAQKVAVPPEAYRVTVDVLDVAGEVRGWLGNVPLPPPK